MDNYFYIKWKEEIIGILARIDNIYYTRFQSKILNSKEGKTIVKLTSFKPNRLYKNDELFEFFKRRIRVEIGEDECDRLKRTGAKIPTDNFSIEDMDEKKAKQFKKIVDEWILTQTELNKKGTTNAYFRN